MTPSGRMVRFSVTWSTIAPPGCVLRMKTCSVVGTGPGVSGVYWPLIWIVPAGNGVGNSNMTAVPSNSVFSGTGGNLPRYEYGTLSQPWTSSASATRAPTSDARAAGLLDIERRRRAIEQHRAGRRIQDVGEEHEHGRQKSGRNRELQRRGADLETGGNGRAGELRDPRRRRRHPRREAPRAAPGPGLQEEQEPIAGRRARARRQLAWQGDADAEVAGDRRRGIDVDEDGHALAVDEERVVRAQRQLERGARHFLRRECGPGHRQERGQRERDEPYRAHGPTNCRISATAFSVSALACCMNP